MKKYLAVFDWNGTLFDDLEASVKGNAAALEIFGLSAMPLKHYQNIFTFPLINFFRRAGVSEHAYLEKHEEAASVFFETYENEAKNCSLRPMVPEFLEWLNENGVACAILSNHLIENTESQLERFNISKFFSHISCKQAYDTDYITKLNKTERLKKIMDDGGYDPECAFIIGDSLEEPEVASQMGMTSISISGGCVSRKRLAEIKPDILIDSFNELFPLVGEMWNLDYRKAS